MKGHILAVDDDEDLRESLCELLREMGYTVVGVYNGQEALDHLLEGHEPKVILLDLMMPVMSGWAFREAQLADPRFATIPVIAMTANSNFDGRSLRALAIVSKPFNLDLLTSLIRSL